MANIFISYAHADGARAQRLLEALKCDFEVWWDPHIQPGKDFRAEILQQITDAACVVVLWSQASVASPYVVGEATEAMEGGKLLPVLLERDVKLPLGLGHLQATDLSDWNGQPGHAQLERLIDSIRAFTARVDTGGARTRRTTDVRSLAPSETRARVHYLKDTRRHIENLLKASIHNARFLDLGIADTPRATHLPWIYKNAEIEQQFTTVADAFEAFDRRMLLLGAPGAGKTVTLLHLALDLVEEAERSSAAPIPLVVNLSKFAIEPSAPSLVDRLFSARAEPVKRDRLFETWLAAELAERPGVSRAAATRWVEEGRIAALLDGLDEVNDERRIETADLLNTTYLKQHPDSVVVVCSRIADYEPLQDRMSARLQLTGAITLQPLGADQIEAYLTTARASGLRHALGRDDALFELAQTPLTLSMMTLAYGGRSADDIPSLGPRTDQRHRLLESFVVRMLQRTERRARDIPFDDDREREIPPRRYLFHPDRVNAYLGWLATRLSVRSQTSCSLRTLHSFLARTSGGEPSPDAWTIRAARTMFVAAILAAVGLVMMPFDARAGTAIALLGVTAGCVVTYFAYSVLRERRPRDSTWIGMAIGCFLIFPGFAAVSRSLSTLLPFELSPVPAGLLAAAAVASLLGGALEQATGARRSVTAATTAIGFAAGVALVYSDRVAWTGGVPLAATTVGGLMSGLWIMLAREAGGYGEKAQAIAITILVLAFVLLLQDRGLAILGSLHWAVAFALIGSALVLIAMSPKSSLSLLAVAVTAAGGHLLADEEGSILAVALVAVAWMAWHLAGMGSHIGPERALVPWRDLDKRCENLVEYAVLSPLTAKCLAAQGRLPWRLRRFLRYAADALLLKPFDGEIEFVHRRLRDHFALRELVPQLDETDTAIRTRAVAALGFQGVSAVDALSDLAQGGDVGEKVLAVKALGRIAAPEAADVLEQSMSDPSPEVRAAVIGSLGNTGWADRSRLLKRAAGDDALAVQYALIDAILDPDLDGAPDQLLMEILERRLYPVELLRHVCSRAGIDDFARDLADGVGRGLPDAARDQVKALLKDSDGAVRLKACQWIANKAALGDLETLADLLGVDPVPSVRAAAASALAEIQDSTAVPRLIEALADDDAGVRSSAARAMSHFEDERVVDPLIALLDDKSAGMREVVVELLGQMAEPRAVEPLIRALGDEVRAVRCEATRSLKQLGDQRAVEPLVRCLEDPDDVFWEWAAIALLGLDRGRASVVMRRFLSDKSLVKRTAAVRALAADLDSIPAALLSRDVDEDGRWLDPAEPITRERVARCASVLNISENEIRAHYEALAPDFKLRLKW